MTTTQVNAMRQMWEEVSVVKGAKYTAREMALMSHRLHGKDQAITADGRHFVWDSRNECWSQWR